VRLILRRRVTSHAQHFARRSPESAPEGVGFLSRPRAPLVNGMTAGSVCFRKWNVRPSQLVIVSGAFPKHGVLEYSDQSNRRFFDLRYQLPQVFNCKGRKSVGDAPSRVVEIGSKSSWFAEHCSPAQSGASITDFQSPKIAMITISYERLPSSSVRRPTKISNSPQLFSMGWKQAQSVALASA
jgi:hypothetical protein